MEQKNPKAKLALRFVLVIGVVQLFADMTYEGARGIIGPFLGSLGASATVVGFTAGFGELMGYGFRSVTGYLADKTHKYWAFIFAGYLINMLAVPALALAGNWPMAAALVVAERTGRAIRKPSTDAMLSHAGSQIGHGWAFGLNEFLDQTGATIGPLIMALVLYRQVGYHHAFAFLLVPALLCLAMVVIARTFYPRPHELEERSPVVLETKGFSKAYWFYALVFGKLLDKFGQPIILIAFSLGALFAPCVFLGGFPLALAGMILWGVGMGAQDSLLKATLSRVIPREKRSTAFGIFDTAFGLAWFAGSATMGLLYDRSILAVVIYSMALQLAALPFFVMARTKA